jgi:hypothetical protein
VADFSSYLDNSLLKTVLENINIPKKFVFGNSITNLKKAIQKKVHE